MMYNVVKSSKRHCFYLIMFKCQESCSAFKIEILSARCCKVSCNWFVLKRRIVTRKRRNIPKFPPLVRFHWSDWRRRMSLRAAMRIYPYLQKNGTDRRPAAPVPFVSGRLNALEDPLISGSPDISLRPFVSHLLSLFRVSVKLQKKQLFQEKLLIQVLLQSCQCTVPTLVNRSVAVKIFTNLNHSLKCHSLF